MYIFVPSWYGDDAGWIRHTNIWHRAGRRMEFDDTVNQIKVFQMSGEEVGIILLGCVPDLRHFLHREKIGGVGVWSAFDEIQNIKGNAPQQVFLNDFAWARELEWVYTPFVMVGYRDGKLCARADFAEDGWLAETTLYEDGIPVRKMHLDDRGFISYSEFYDRGEPQLRMYYDREGVWQVLEDLNRGFVTVNAETGDRFDRTAYSGMEQLIEEMLGKHLAKSPMDTLIIAMDGKHNAMVERTAGGRELAYSLFSRRNKKPNREACLRCLRGKRILVTDTQYMAEGLRKRFPEYGTGILDITPYDARVSFGDSTKIKELKVLFYMDETGIQYYVDALRGVLTYMKENKNVCLTIGTGGRMAERISGDMIKDMLDMLMERMGVHFVFEENTPDIAENETGEKEQPRITVRRCVTETDIIEVLSDHRVIMDVSRTPDLYLQIAGISAGLPMILGAESRYVTHRENGWILEDEAETEEALRFFLAGLGNWNRALVTSLRKISDYTNGNIVKKWKEAMERMAVRDDAEDGSH